MTAHFTAVLKVTKITEAYTEEKQYSEKIQHPRDVRDVAEVVIRADTLAKLKERLTAHVQLVQEY